MPHIEPYSESEIDLATDQAMATLLWQAGENQDGETGEYLFTWDDKYTVEDFADGQRDKMREFLASFMEANLEDLVSTGHVHRYGDNSDGIKQIGHDYVLTTGGHGAGFWDRGLGEAGDRLSEVCRAERHEWALYEHEGVLYCYDLEG